MNTKKRKKRQKPNDIVTKEANQKKAELLDELSPGVLEKLPLPDREKIKQIIVSRSHRGPIPSSDELHHYERVCPGAANRIIAMAEKEQNFRVDTTDRRDKYDYTLASRGQFFAIISLILILLFCVFLAYIGSTSGAVTVGCTLVISIVTVFVTGKRVRNGNIKNTTQEKTTKK